MSAKCPLMIVEWGWPENDAYAPAQVPFPPRPCDADLHLVWSFDLPLDGDDHVFEDSVADHACTDQWEVVCENGHTIARSSGEENAEPFHYDIAFDAPGSLPAEGEQTP
jgi:hypothetical protein